MRKTGAKEKPVALSNEEQPEKKEFREIGLLFMGVLFRIFGKAPPIVFGSSQSHRSVKYTKRSQKVATGNDEVSCDACDAAGARFEPMHV